MAKKVLGIEIGSKTIKMALIKNGKKPALLEIKQEATPKKRVSGRQFKRHRGRGLGHTGRDHTEQGI